MITAISTSLYSRGAHLSFHNVRPCPWSISIELAAILLSCHVVAAAAKDAKRAVRSGERDLDRELRHLERSEKALVLEIKKTAKSGNQASIDDWSGAVGGD